MGYRPGRHQPAHGGPRPYSTRGGSSDRSEPTAARNDRPTGLSVSHQPNAMRIKAASAKSHSLRRPQGWLPRKTTGQCASVLIIVLWIALGLVSITLYFANSMSSELRASDNRVSGIAAEQGIEGAARYLTYILSNFGTNGVMLDPADYLCEAVPVGDAHFWLIGRDTNSPVGPGQVFFGLVDEASKLNLNFATSNMFAALLQS